MGLPSTTGGRRRAGSSRPSSPRGVSSRPGHLGAASVPADGQLREGGRPARVSALRAPPPGTSRRPRRRGASPRRRANPRATRTPTYGPGAAFWRSPRSRFRRASLIRAEFWLRAYRFRFGRTCASRSRRVRKGHQAERGRLLRRALRRRPSPGRGRCPSASPSAIPQSGCSSGCDRPPDHREDEDFHGTAAWRFPDFRIVVDYNSMENLLTRVQVFAGGGQPLIRPRRRCIFTARRILSGYMERGRVHGRRCRPAPRGWTSREPGS